MATRTRKTEKQKERENIKVESFTITRAHEFEGGNVAFDMMLNGISFFGMTVVKGKNGDFISFPQRKSGGRYYSYYFINLDEKDSESIMDAVYEKLD